MENVKMNEKLPAHALEGFKSTGFRVGHASSGLWPAFSGVRVMMMPFHVLDPVGSLPASLDAYKPLLQEMLKGVPPHVAIYPEADVGYLTIHEKVVGLTETHRNPGLHVDGVYKGELAGAWGGGGGGWGSCGNGMLLTSNVGGMCSMWTGQFPDTPFNPEGRDGNCEHLRKYLSQTLQTTFQAGDIYWMDGLCVHESLSPAEVTPRQLVRISLPNTAPWFVGYTENPLGVKPAGEIINERRI